MSPVYLTVIKSDPGKAVAELQYPDLVSSQLKNGYIHEIGSAPKFQVGFGDENGNIFCGMIKKTDLSSNT